MPTITSSTIAHQRYVSKQEAPCFKASGQKRKDDRPPGHFIARSGKLRPTAGKCSLTAAWLHCQRQSHTGSAPRPDTLNASWRPDRTCLAGCLLAGCEFSDTRSSHSLPDPAAYFWKQEPRSGWEMGQYLYLAPPSSSAGGWRTLCGRAQHARPGSFTARGTTQTVL